MPVWRICTKAAKNQGPCCNSTGLSPNKRNLFHLTFEIKKLGVFFRKTIQLKILVTAFVPEAPGNLYAMQNLRPNNAKSAASCRSFFNFSHYFWKETWKAGPISTEVVELRIQNPEFVCSDGVVRLANWSRNRCIILGNGQSRKPAGPSYQVMKAFLSDCSKEVIFVSSDLLMWRAQESFVWLFTCGLVSTGTSILIPFQDFSCSRAWNNKTCQLKEHVELLFPRNHKWTFQWDEKTSLWLHFVGTNCFLSQCRSHEKQQCDFQEITHKYKCVCWKKYWLRRITQKNKHTKGDVVTSESHASRRQNLSACQHTHFSWLCCDLHCLFSPATLSRTNEIFF